MIPAAKDKSPNPRECTCAAIRNLARVLFRTQVVGHYYAWGCPLHDPTYRKVTIKKAQHGTSR